MISFIICSHNRAELLRYCLASFEDQTHRQAGYEIVVVDNASTDSTAKEVERFADRLPITYCLEEQIGLSYARNRGYEEARFDWVLYVDDDAKVYPDFIERSLWLIDKYNFDCIGGRFFPWYLSPKPVWLSSEFGLFPLLRDSVGEISVQQHVAGGVLLLRKAALEKVDGFPVNLGMSGDTIGYGEENWVQDEMRKNGFTIAFDPELRIDHLVASYKFTLRWQLRRMYAKGQTERRMSSHKIKPGQFILLLRATAFTGYSLLINLVKFTRKDYYWQNYILESFGYMCKVIGYRAA